MKTPEDESEHLPPDDEEEETPAESPEPEKESTMPGTGRDYFEVIAEGLRESSR